MTHKLWLTIIVLLSLVLRLIKLDSFPPPNRDELDIGYNAYSLLHTGKDEYGTSWPLSFKSFGDYKLPGLIYSTAISVAIGGFNLVTTRWPNVVLSVLTLVCVYFLARELIPSGSFSLWSALMAATGYGIFHGSRSAYEPVAALFFSSLAWFLLLYARKHRPVWLGLICMPMLMAFFYQTGATLIIPLIIIAFFIYRKEYRLAWFQMAGIVLITALLYGCSWIPTWGVNTTKMGTTIFTETKTVDLMATNRLAAINAGLPSPIAHLLINRVSMGMLILMQNYVTAYNPEFLLIKGGNNSWHNLAFINYGYVSYISMLGFGLGCLFLLTHITRRREAQFLLALLVLTPLPHALTIDIPNANRLQEFFLVIAVVAAYGFWQLTQYVNHRSQLLVTIVLMAVIGIDFGWFYYRYITYQPASYAINYIPEAPELVRLINRLAPAYDAVMINESFDFAATYFAFYTPITPAMFHQAEWTMFGFSRVTHWDKFYFQVSDSQWSRYAKEPFRSTSPHQRVLYITRTFSPPTSREVVSIPTADNSHWLMEPYMIKNINSL